MTKLEEVKESIVYQLTHMKYQDGDLTDLGNEVGIAIGKYTLDDDAEETAFDLDSFISGLRHGVELWGIRNK